MTEHVYRPVRNRNGKKVKSRIYRGRYKILGSGKLHDVALKTTDAQVARQMLRQIVRDAEREAAGILAPKRLRDAADRPLTDHLQDYIQDLEVQGRDNEYVRHVKNRVKTLAESCEWKRIGDISADSFQSWRSRKAASPKTLNDYLCALISFLNWLSLQGRIEVNPLSRVAKVETRGRETFHRRALSVEECHRLLQGAGDREILYLLALTTGLRRGEIDGLLWSDACLDDPAPCLRVRASTTKNHQATVVPLRPEIANRLRIAKESASMESDFIFPDGIPENKELRNDFIRAGIPLEDATGARMDFHALRHTFCTLLHQSGVSARVAMEMMRHSDMRLTARVYTDAQALPTREALMSLPSLVNDSLIDSLPASFSTVSDCLEMTHGDAKEKPGEFDKRLFDNVLGVNCPDLSCNDGKNKMAERGGFEPPVAL